MTPREAAAAREERRFQGLITKTDGCWLWRGGRTNGGYGRFGRRLAHRRSYEQARGPIPAGLELDHLCRTRHCVNPEHLEPVTHLVNIRRGNGPGQRTHCPRGHAYDTANTYRAPNGRRYCRTCVPILHARSRLRRRARVLASRLPLAVRAYHGAKPGASIDAINRPLVLA